MRSVVGLSLRFVFEDVPAFVGIGLGCLVIGKVLVGGNRVGIVFE